MVMEGRELELGVKGAISEKTSETDRVLLSLWGFHTDLK